MAEDGLRAQVSQQNMTAIIWTLKAHKEAKRRGWGERTELTGPNGGPISTRDETTGLSDDDLRRKLLSLGKAAAFLADPGGETVSGNTPGASDVDPESEE